MAVTTQVLQTDFSEGLDEGVDALTLQSPKLLRADNVLFTNKGSLKKRFGYDKYNTYLTNTVSNPNRIFTHNDSLCVTDDTRLWSLDESAISGNRFVSVADNQSQPLITRKAIKHHSNIITGYDSIICVPAANAAAKYEASYTMSVYDPNNLYRELSISVKDLVSGSNRAAQITTISLGFMRMSMAFSNNLLLIVYINTSTNAIDGYYLDLSSNITTITAITNLVTDVAAITYGGLDLLAVSNGFLMSYCCNDGASRLKIQNYRG
jgi:hypothetical protein